MSSAKAYYERYWTPEGVLPSGPMDQKLWDLLEAHVRPDSSCLDIGCGDGRTYGWWLGERAKQYLGLDISENAVARARQLGLDARAIDDAASFPFGDEEYDAATCIEVLEHLFEPHTAVAEVFRVLRPGGVLIATVPNVAYWRRRADLFVFGRWNPLGDEHSVDQPWRDPHIRFFTAPAFERMLRRAGFADVEVAGHAGGVLQDIPGLRRLGRGRGTSQTYRRLEDRFPALLGGRLHAVATKPR